MIGFSLGSEHEQLEVTVQGPTPTNNVSFLCIRTGNMTAEIYIFRRGPLGVEKILDLGYEIVNACRKLQSIQEIADDSRDVQDAMQVAVQGELDARLADLETI